MNNSPEFDSSAQDFNESSTSFLEGIAQTLREQLMASAHHLIDDAYKEEVRNSVPLQDIADTIDSGAQLDPEQEEYLVVLASKGMPIYMKRHDPVFKEIQVGAKFVDAVSSRLVERKFIPGEAQAYTPPHRWPIGDEMVVYIPVMIPHNDNPTIKSPKPTPDGDVIFINYITRDTDGNEVQSRLYAIGKNYCYEHHTVGDSEVEMEFFMQNPAEFAANLRLEDLNLDRLVLFLLEMIKMKQWPINTYWPGVNASPIKSV